MKPISLITLAAATYALTACSSGGEQQEAPLAGAWSLDGGQSHLSFVTVKGGQVAEAHNFGGLSGTVDANGAAELIIDLNSVETNVDIRNDRMKEVLFDTAASPNATVSVQIDPAALAALKIGESVNQPVSAMLDLHGVTGEVAADLAVTRIAEGRVKVETLNPIIIDAGSFDLAPGVDELRELAGLDSITNAVPVTFSLTFTQTD